MASKEVNALLEMNQEMDKNRRLSILNNQFLLDDVKKEVGIDFTVFDGELLLTTRQVSDYYQVEERTLRRLIEANRAELENNGYKNIEGADLKSFREYVKDKNVLNIKTPVVSVFSFKAFLNAGMLLQGSERAKEMRRLLLDLAVSIINQKAGGNTKYINQRDESFLPASFNNEQYNDKLKVALVKCVDMGNGKFPKTNNLVYKAVFNESAQKYKETLELTKNDKTRDTMYSEVLNTISSIENGVAREIETVYENNGKKKISKEQLEGIFASLSSNPFLEPQIEDARRKMASFDNEFRQKQHTGILEYISPVNSEAYERFLGKKSKELSERIDENIEEFKRLKDK